MLSPLLSTKLYFTSARSGLISRLRLVEQLQVGLNGPLTLIAAPAGSGKTSDPPRLTLEEVEIAFKLAKQD